MKVVHRKKTVKEIVEARFQVVLSKVRKCARDMKRDHEQGLSTYPAMMEGQALIEQECQRLTSQGRLKMYLVRPFTGDPADPLEAAASDAAYIGGVLVQTPVYKTWWIDKDFEVQEVN